MTETAVAVVLTGAIMPLLTLLCQRGMEWINNRQKNTRETRADALAEWGGLYEKQGRELKALTERMDDQERCYEKEIREVRLELQQCQELHAQERTLTGRLTERIGFMEDALTAHNIKFRPYVPSGSDFHRPLPKDAKPPEGETT